jgi:hypothetical protein
MLAEGVNRAFSSSGRADTVVIVRKGSDAELSSAIGAEYLALFRGPAQVSQAGGVIGEIVVVVIADHNDGSGSSNVLVRGPRRPRASRSARRSRSSTVMRRSPGPTRSSSARRSPVDSRACPRARASISGATGR